MALSFVDFGTGTLGGVLAHDRNNFGRFSDGTLFIVAIDTTGTRKLVLWVSFDGGASWAQSASGDIISSMPDGSQYTTQVGDTLHIALVDVDVVATTTELQYVQLVWSPATKTYTTPQLKTVIDTLTGFPTDNYQEASFSVEPGGRIWCLERELSVGFFRYHPFFSDDGGATWTIGNLGSQLDSSNATASEGFIFCTEFNTIVGYCDNTSGNAFKTRQRPHTDAATAAWAAKVDRDSLTPPFGGNVLSAAHAGRDGSGNIKEICWVYGVRTSSPTPQLCRLTKLNEDGVGGFSFTSHAVYTYSAHHPGPGSLFPSVTGYDDGYRVYLYDPTLNLTDLRQFTTPKLHTAAVSVGPVEVLPFTGTGEANIGDAFTLLGSSVASVRLMAGFDGTTPFKVGTEGFASVALPGVGDDGRRRWSHLSRLSWKRMGRTRR